MTGMTTAQKQALLAQYVAAEAAVLRGQAYSIKDRSLTRADLRWIQNGREKLEKELAEIAKGSSMQAKRVIFRDN